MIKRFKIAADYDVAGYGTTEKEDPSGEWVKYEDIKPILTLSMDFGLIHMGDGDELGIMARKLLKLIGDIK